jgi:hypothetical protein
MRKTLLMAIIAVGMGFSASAETVLMEFYGTKARNSYTNPCKGETIRLCGRVLKDIQVSAQGLTIVTETVMDDQGQIINSSTYCTSKEPGEILEETLTSAPDNSTTTIYTGNEIPED